VTSLFIPAILKQLQGGSFMKSEISSSSKTVLSNAVHGSTVISSLIVTAMAVLLATPKTQAGDSGCGLGSVIIQKNSKGLQLLSMTTNSFFFTQPLGITSGTSGCSSSGLVSNDKEIQYFVEVNQDDLSREMAVGQGEKLETLASLSGCKTAEAKSAFAQMTQKSYENIYTDLDVTPQSMIQNLQAEMIKNKQVGQLCGVMTAEQKIENVAAPVTQ
jgi:hypothetical protein